MSKLQIILKFPLFKVAPAYQNLLEQNSKAQSHWWMEQLECSCSVSHGTYAGCFTTKKILVTPNASWVSGWIFWTNSRFWFNDLLFVFHDITEVFTNHILEENTCFTNCMIWQCQNFKNILIYNFHYHPFLYQAKVL